MSVKGTSVRPGRGVSGLRLEAPVHTRLPTQQTEAGAVQCSHTGAQVSPGASPGILHQRESDVTQRFGETGPSRSHLDRPMLHKHKYMDPGLNPKHPCKKLGMVIHACNAGTEEGPTDRSQHLNGQSKPVRHRPSGGNKTASDREKHRGDCPHAHSQTHKPSCLLSVFPKQ